MIDRTRDLMASDDNIRIMTVTGQSRSPARTEIDVRGMTLTIDEPPERGGANAGATPPETLLGALVGCTSRISHKIAAAHGFEIRDMSIAVEAAFDRRGVNLEKEVDIPFLNIEITIDLTTNASEGAIELLKTELRKFCPVSKMLRRAGTTITALPIVGEPHGWLDLRGPSDYDPGAALPRSGAHFERVLF